MLLLQSCSDLKFCCNLVLISNFGVLNLNILILVNSTCECKFFGIDHPKKILCEEEKTPSQKLQAESEISYIWWLVHRMVHYLMTLIIEASMRWGVDVDDHAKFINNGDRRLCFKCRSSDSSKMWWLKRGVCKIGEWMWVPMKTSLTDIHLLL